MSWIEQSFGLPRWSKFAKNSKNWRRIAQYQTDIQYQELFTYFTNLILNLFEWEGLPETCRPEALEKTLYFYGRAIFFRDDSIWNKGDYPTIIDESAGQYWHTPVMFTGQNNIYMEPIQRRAYSYQYNRVFNQDNSVVIKNNPLMSPSYFTTSLFCEKLVDAARSIDIASRNLRIPFIMTGPESATKAFEEYQAKLDAGQNTILIVKGGSLDDLAEVKVHITQAAGQHLGELWDHYHSTFSELLTRFGINNANTDKRERLITSEAEANDEIVNMSLYTMLDARKNACKEIAQIFPDIPEPTVKIRNISVIKDTLNLGGVDDGTIYPDRSGTTSDDT